VEITVPVGTRCFTKVSCQIKVLRLDDSKAPLNSRTEFRTEGGHPGNPDHTGNSLPSECGTQELHLATTTGPGARSCLQRAIANGNAQKGFQKPRTFTHCHRVKFYRSTHITQPDAEGTASKRHGQSQAHDNRCGPRRLRDKTAFGKPPASAWCFLCDLRPGDKVKSRSARFEREVKTAVTLVART
jgi:hypothetical protein